MRFLYVVLAAISIVLFTGCTSSGASAQSTPANSKDVVREYFTGGKLMSEFFITDPSTQSGILKKYGYDGKLTSTAEIKYGRKHGIETIYDPGGGVLQKTPYVNNVIDGEQIAYYEDGSPMISTHYVNGIKHGSYKTYKRDGSLYKEVIFNDGKIVR
jgi:antitoxin component YwqK of YwqJK toxin-antitoxin module